MLNLKAIRDRIQSVKNTKKIMEAMRLVAAAKGGWAFFVLSNQLPHNILKQFP